MKNLITVRADDNIKGYSEFTLPLIKEFAKKWNADFKLLSDESICNVGDGKFHYRILELKNLLNDYDRVLNLDADMIITPNCPNPFTTFPSDTIATVFEDKGSRKSQRVSLMKQIQNKMGDVEWSDGYINTGFFMVSKEHKNIFEGTNEDLWVGFGFDDVYLGYMINKYNHKIIDIGYKFNHMTMFSESWNNNANRFESNIIHYAGNGIFDVNKHPTKFEQMKSDFNIIYNS